MGIAAHKARNDEAQVMFSMLASSVDKARCVFSEARVDIDKAKRSRSKNRESMMRVAEDALATAITRMSLAMMRRDAFIVCKEFIKIMREENAINVLESMRWREIEQQARRIDLSRDRAAKARAFDHMQHKRSWSEDANMRDAMDEAYDDYMHTLGLPRYEYGGVHS
jgi:hypothetical protein